MTNITHGLTANVAHIIGEEYPSKIFVSDLYPKIPDKT